MFLVLSLTGCDALAQGFAGLGTDADGFATPRRGTDFTFPRDHGPHPEYRIEWWYLTANLTDIDGRDYGLQWTLFRSALRPEGGLGWGTPQLWMGHAAVTTPQAHHHAEKFARGGIGHAGARADPFSAWIDDWHVTGIPGGGDALDTLRLAAAGVDFSYEMDLTATGPLVMHGEAGFSVKSAEGQASYYYSQPFYRIEGTLRLPDGDMPVSGVAWLDREWSSQPLSGNQAGWDWFSFRFDDGARLMTFRLRQTDGTYFTSGTWIAPDGATTALADGAIRMTPLRQAKVAGRSVPVEWRVEVPAHGVDIVSEPVNPQAWMETTFPYWEGPIRIGGSHEGRGYLEMTGYE
ncbi:MAG: lipocalin-like domain-containing protein [Pseudomonadota bacterium]